MGKDAILNLKPLRVCDLISKQSMLKENGPQIRANQCDGCETVLGKLMHKQCQTQATQQRILQRMDELIDYSLEEDTRDAVYTNQMLILRDFAKIACIDQDFKLFSRQGLNHHKTQVDVMQQRPFAHGWKVGKSVRRLRMNLRQYLAYQVVHCFFFPSVTPICNN